MINVKQKTNSQFGEKRLQAGDSNDHAPLCSTQFGRILVAICRSLSKKLEHSGLLTLMVYVKFIITIHMSRMALDSGKSLRLLNSFISFAMPLTVMPFMHYKKSQRL